MSITDEREAAPPILWFRLGVGLVQGLAAWALIETADRASNAPLFAALVLVTAFAPLPLLAGLGRMRARTLLVWTLVAAAVLAGLAAYDLWREPLDGSALRKWPSPPLLGFGAAALYIAHHLVEPADRERRLHPSYEARFEDASRHAFQLGLSLAFTGVFWLVLFLGGALFDLIGVKMFGEVLRKSWFASPVTAVAFAAAVQLTDVRPGLIRGIRSVGLTLLAWLLPLMTGLTCAFLVALVFTGVEPLWATRRAAQILLFAAAALIVLTNAAYQDGQGREDLPGVLRAAGRVAALLLVPLTVLAAWATGLRIAQYGLTAERVAAVAVLVVAAVFALGYAHAALAQGRWLRRIEAVNVAGAVAVLAVILALFSPLADPARLAVSDQVARLKAGRTAVDRFDFQYLRFDAGRFGRAALADLARSPDPKIAAAARAMQARKDRSARPAEAGRPFAAAILSGALPEDFRAQAFTDDEAGGVGCVLGSAPCRLYAQDITGDGAPEVLAYQGSTLTAFARADGRWRAVGRYEGAGCDGVEAALKLGPPRLVPAPYSDLEVAGRRLPFSEIWSCPAKPGAPARPAKNPPPFQLGPAFKGG
jgi:hypothetical protein